MKRQRFVFLLLGGLSLSTGVNAELCDDVTNVVRPLVTEAVNDVNFYEQIFPDTTLQGDRRYNEIVLQCNRKRDSKGNEITRVLGTERNTNEKQSLKAASLDPKVIRGHYNFVGLPIGAALSFKYVYVLSKKDGVWSMVIPYKPAFNELVPNRVDFSFSHASHLYDASQVENAAGTAQVLNLKPSAQPISITLCSTTTYFPGEAGAYSGKGLHQRDPENKAISLGKIEYKYDKDEDAYSGCRVDKNKQLYWRWDDARNQVVKVRPQDWVLDNFVRTTEAYWSIKNVFQLKLLLKGHNEATFPKSTRDLLRDDDYLTVNFATKFLRAHFNQMYKSNVFQVNNFSTMTTDGSYWHESGHAFGLDDEYGFVNAEDGKKSCRNDRMSGLYQTADYQMCEGGATLQRTIYHYLALSRYVTKQSECTGDPDCKDGEYCNAGIDLTKNQCVAKKADNETCELVGGGHQCKSGNCKLSRCYTPNSVATGGTCYLNDACKEGKCSSLDGTRGTCVCNADSDCGEGKWCNAGVDVNVNRCEALKNDNETCDLAGGGHQCKSGHCKFSRCYTPGSVAMNGACYSDDACKEGKCSAVDGARGTCVCKEDRDCGTGKWCDAGLDTKVNACRAKLPKGAKCGTAATVGNDHKCSSGECSGFPKYECK